MTNPKDELLQWIPRLAGHAVLVIGDLFLDEYLYGQATRLSREAPIPVLEYTHRALVPGGAANPANNIAALHSHATVLGVIGADPQAGQLLGELQRCGVASAGAVTDASRPTTTKTRIMAEGSLRFPQQLARLDRIERQDVRGQVEDALLEQLERLLPSADAVLVSDYQTGTATPRLVEATHRAARAANKLCAVDAQGAFRKYAGFDVIKANRQEVEAGLGCTLNDETAVQVCGQQLLAQIDAGAAIITRGPEGLSVLSRTGECVHVPAANRTEVYDVTGAGDTVIAVTALALLAGAPLVTAARLANYAAGLVVRRVGNAVVSPAELAWAIQNW